MANNLYQGWEQYAIGGSSGPSIKSEANLFIAPEGGNKEVYEHGSIAFRSSAFEVPFFSVTIISVKLVISMMLMHRLHGD